MTFSIKIADATFTNFTDKLFPNFEDALAFHLFGVDGPTSVANLVNPAAPGSIVGTPTYTRNGILVNATAYVNSAISGGAPFTLAIASPTENPIAKFGGARFLSGPGSVRASRGGGDISISTPAKPSGVNALFRCITYDTFNQLNLYVSDGTTTLLTGTFTGSTTYTNPDLFTVGGISGMSQGTANAASLHSIAMDASQVQDLFEYFDFKLRSRGLFITP